MTTLVSNLFPEMNIFLGRLEIVLLDLAKLGILPEGKMKFLLFFYDEQKDIKIVEKIGHDVYSKIVLNETKICLKDFRSSGMIKKKISMFPSHGNCIGISSEFENPKLDQAIVLLWVVVMNINQNKEIFYVLVSKETERIMKILKMRNPYVKEIASMLKKAKMGVLALS